MGGVLERYGFPLPSMCLQFNSIRSSCPKVSVNSSVSENKLTRYSSVSPLPLCLSGLIDI